MKTQDTEVDGAPRPRRRSAGAGAAPPLAPISKRELDWAVAERKEPSRRLAVARQQSAALAARASRVELLAIGILGAIIALALSAAVATLASPGSVLGADTVKLAAGAIFAGAYLALAIGTIPGLRIDRAGVALVGACLMVGAGVLTLEEASRAVDFGTITLLLGITIVVANLRLSGFFALANAWVARHVHRPIVLLAADTIVSGLFSAFLVNDAICLVLSPLVLELTLHLKRKPTPYLLAVAMASNIGSTATITGNPQNIMIGSFSHLPYLQFTLALAPVALVGLVLTVLLHQFPIEAAICPLANSKHRVMKRDRASARCPRMLANPPALQSRLRRWRQDLRVARTAYQICVYPVHHFGGAAREDVANHEASAVVLGVLAGTKAVDALYDILAGEHSIAFRHTLTLNDRVRIMLA